MITAIRTKSDNSNSTCKWHIKRRGSVTSMCGLVEDGRRTHRTNGVVKVTGSVEGESLSEIQEKIGGKFGEMCDRCEDQATSITFGLQYVAEEVREEMLRLSLEEGVPTTSTTEYLMRKGLEAHKSERHTPSPEHSHEVSKVIESE